MDKYIGIDVHASSCTIAVVDARGKQVGSHVVATNGREIVECLRAIPGQRHVCFEEGTQSGWLYEVLEPHAVEVVVAGVGASSRGSKDEPLNAAYQRWLAAGSKPNLAKVSLARKIAAIALMMWKTEEEYDSSKHSKTVSP
jgi:hypothetical protein